MKILNNIKEYFVNHSKQKTVLLIVGISILGLGAQLLYDNLLFPLFRPRQYGSRKLKRKIEKISVNNKTIIFLESVEKIIVSEKGIQFLCFKLKNIDLKPSNLDGKSKNPFLPPYPEDQYVQDLSLTHVLLFNKFPIIKNQMLIITSKFELQTSLLTASDFAASQKVLQALNGYCFFNSGKNSGGSQQHKHIQAMPFESLLEAPLICAISERILKLKEKVVDLAYAPFNFQHIIKVLRSIQPTETEESYGLYLEQCYIDCQKKLENLEMSEKGEQKIKEAYNMIYTDNFMFLVLRKQDRPQTFPNTSINGMGFCGCLFFKSDEDCQIEQINSPFKLLEEVTFQNTEREIKLQRTPLEGFDDILSVQVSGVQS